MAKNRKIYSALGALLLLAGLFLLIAQKPDQKDGSIRPGKTSAKNDTTPQAQVAPVRSGDRKREAAQKYWLVAKEVPGSEKAAGAPDSPLVLSYLKSDPERKTLRVGFHQDAHEEVEPNDYDVEVNLLGPDGENLGEENTSSAMWWTEQEDFSSKGVPMFEVKSLNPVAVVELKLTYKGQAVEHRKYEVAGR